MSGTLAEPTLREFFAATSGLDSTVAEYQAACSTPSTALPALVKLVAGLRGLKLLADRAGIDFDELAERIGVRFPTLGEDVEVEEEPSDDGDDEEVLEVGDASCPDGSSVLVAEAVYALARETRRLRNAIVTASEDISGGLGSIEVAVANAAQHIGSPG